MDMLPMFPQCVKQLDIIFVLRMAGGEWISSIEMENLAMSVQGVAEAAVIGIPDKKWGERPLLVIVPKKPPGSVLLVSALIVHFFGLGVVLYFMYQGPAASRL
jgi:acyl-CoA synthetase (AMP-forming)/AMP-acid ligase II